MVAEGVCSGAAVRVMGLGEVDVKCREKVKMS